MKEFFKKNIIEILFSIVFISIAVKLNLQFIDGSNINTTIAGHDEYIAVKEIYSILHPISLKHFIMAIISGNALYYGRIMFYIDALFAYLPFKIWGVTGMVFSIRLFHSVCLLMGLLILSKTFLLSGLQRVLFYLGTFCLYYTMYFIMMPKPEPMQLVFIALFLNRFKKSNWSFGWHFILIGIAYGLKFNVLLILPLIFILPVIKSGALKIKDEFIPALKSILYTLSGIVVAIPCLILAPLKPIFLSAYIHETFGGTVKGYDNASLTFNDWMSAGLGGSYLGHSYFAYPFYIFLFCLFILNIRKSFRTKDFSSLILMAFGIILSAVIMLKTKRLWPHYLWTSYIFMCVGIISTLPKTINKIHTKVILGFIVLYTSSSVFFFCKRELPLYLNLSKWDDVVLNRKWSTQAFDYININYPGSRVGTDGSVLNLFSQFVEVDVYHPFSGPAPETKETRYQWYWDLPMKIWDKSDLVVFYKRHPKRILIEKSKYQIGHQKEIEYFYNTMVPHKFQRDTNFGEIIIYKRK
jgi:hypothetical protein